MKHCMLMKLLHPPKKRVPLLLTEDREAILLSERQEYDEAFLASQGKARC